MADGLAIVKKHSQASKSHSETYIALTMRYNGTGLFTPKRACFLHSKSDRSHALQESNEVRIIFYGIMEILNRCHLIMFSVVADDLSAGADMQVPSGACRCLQMPAGL